MRFDDKSYRNRQIPDFRLWIVGGLPEKNKRNDR